MLQLTDLPTPEITDPDDVRIAVCAAALNHLDLWVRGGIPGIELSMPHVLGSDGAGVIDALGDGVEAFASPRWPGQ